jgi:hypothetical protein
LLDHRQILFRQVQAAGYLFGRWRRAEIALQRRQRMVPPGEQLGPSESCDFSCNFSRSCTMSHRRRVPAYRRHSSKDQAVVDVYRVSGKRTRVYLPGPFDSPASRAAYADLLARLAAHDGFLPDARGRASPGDLTVSQLVLRFLAEKVEVDYVDATGAPTTEQYCYQQVVRPLCGLFGWAIARTFDARSLGAVRQHDHRKLDERGGAD